MVWYDSQELHSIGTKVPHARRHNGRSSLGRHQREHCLHQVWLVFYKRDKSCFVTQGSDGVIEAGCATTMKENKRLSVKILQRDTLSLRSAVIGHCNQQRLFVER